MGEGFGKRLLTERMGRCEAATMGRVVLLGG
jgi:hypothetical protein